MRIKPSLLFSNFGRYISKGSLKNSFRLFESSIDIIQHILSFSIHSVGDKSVTKGRVAVIRE